MKPVIYAMSGPIGSGKTTCARKLASEKNAIFFSIDHCVKLLRQPIGSAEDYEKYYFGVRDIIANFASQTLANGVSVVLDFGGTKGHWAWLKPIAQAAMVEVEVDNLIVPIEIRRERVRSRNKNPETIFHFSDHEFDSMPQESVAPDAEPGLRIVEIRN